MKYIIYIQIIFTQISSFNTKCRINQAYSILATKNVVVIKIACGFLRLSGSDYAKWIFLKLNYTVNFLSAEVKMQNLKSNLSRKTVALKWNYSFHVYLIAVVVLKCELLLHNQLNGS